MGEKTLNEIVAEFKERLSQVGLGEAIPRLERALTVYSLPETQNMINAFLKNSIIHDHESFKLALAIIAAM